MKRLVRTTVFLTSILLAGLTSYGQRVEIPKPEMAYAREQGADFAAAYQLLLEAPMKSYDYRPATAAFRQLAEQPSLPEGLRRDARFLLCLAEFCDLKFQDAAGESAKLFEMIEKSRQPGDAAKERLARRIAQPGGGGHVENIAQLKEIIYAGSRLKTLLPGDEAEPLVDVTQTVAMVDCGELLAKMRESKVYDQAAAKLGKGKTFDSACEPIVKLLEKNRSHLQRVADRDFYATAGLLALEVGRVDDKLPDLRNSIGLAACAHNLRQIGIAFHLYLLEHEATFPPLFTKSQVRFEGKQAVLTEHYQDLLMPQFGLPAGNLVSSYGVYRGIPEDSVWQCPVSLPSKVGSLCHYGYDGLGPAGLGRGTVKFSAIKPESQLLAADACYCGARDGRGSSALTGFERLCPRHGGYVNVLYADGHVNAEDINWLWEAAPNGSPWNSNKPYAQRADGKPWPFPLPFTDK